MDYIGTTEKEQKEMMNRLGISSVLELLSAVPPSLVLLPYAEDGLSEREGLSKLTTLGKKNTFSSYTSYLGGGAYEHYVPSIVAPLLSRGEFLTAYTPYQPELSQGVLKATFEFQTAIAELTGMEVANSCMYDGATACAEALLMALRVFRGARQKVWISKNINPRYKAVIDLYLPHFEQVETIDESVAAVLMSFPNYYGELEDPRPIFEEAKKVGALSILCTHPIALALYASGKELGADIVIGEGQPLGLPLQFGGPYVGYMACKKSLIREMPGRIVGETVDRNGKKCYVLTLQAREQHIRREKATSNICTSQTLASFAMLITMLWYSSKGLKNLAQENKEKADYLKKGLLKLGLKSRPLETFNEFSITFPKKIDEILPTFEREKILPGLVLGPNSLLIAVTETKTYEDLDRFLEVTKKLCSSGL